MSDNPTRREQLLIQYALGHIIQQLHSYGAQDFEMGPVSSNLKMIFGWAAQLARNIERLPSGEILCFRPDELATDELFGQIEFAVPPLPESLHADPHRLIGHYWMGTYDDSIRAAGRRKEASARQAVEIGEIAERLINKGHRGLKVLAPLIQAELTSSSPGKKTLSIATIEDKLSKLGIVRKKNKTP